MSKPKLDVALCVVKDVIFMQVLHQDDSLRSKEDDDSLVLYDGMEDDDCSQGFKIISMIEPEFVLSDEDDDCIHVYVRGEDAASDEKIISIHDNPNEGNDEFCSQMLEDLITGLRKINEDPTYVPKPLNPPIQHVADA